MRGKRIGPWAHRGHHLGGQIRILNDLENLEKWSEFIQQVYLEEKLPVKSKINNLYNHKNWAQIQNKVEQSKKK